MPAEDGRWPATEGAFLRAARDVAATGAFRGLEGAEPFESLNQMFASTE